MAKQLWISLVHHLNFRGLLDLAPGENFENYTTGHLIDEVKYVLLGPNSWSPAWRLPPKIKRQIVIPLGCQPPGSQREGVSVRLLPGGRYFALQDKTSLQFLDATTGRSVSTYTHSNAIQSWSLDMGVGGNEVFVTFTGADAQYNNAVHIFQTDLLSGHSDHLLRFTLPTHLAYLSPPKILGDFFALSFEIESQAPALVLLVNWRTEQYVLLNCPPSRIGLTLVPGHLAITHPELDPLHQQMLIVYDFASFEPFWRPIHGMSFWDRVYGRELSPVASERLKPGNIPLRHCQIVELTAHASPIRSETYELVLYSVDHIPGPEDRSVTSFLRSRLGGKHPPPPDVKRSVLFSYNFNLSGRHGSRPAWRLISLVPAELHVRGTSLTLSRYCLDRSFRMVIDALVKRGDIGQRVGPRVIVPFQNVCRDIHLAQYSGAVAFLSSSSLTISYYV
ncbi:hypothetical protein C8R44DRAFT_818496 [Mycena epipterygia]|nr:hypothetical protein C8R44DRAFT_818496 [Mycena epipterygia]